MLSGSTRRPAFFRGIGIKEVIEVLIVVVIVKENEELVVVAPSFSSPRSNPVSQKFGRSARRSENSISYGGGGCRRVEGTL